jgi:hypothetical protein
MRLASIRIADTGDVSDALTSCVRALCASEGLNVSYEELHTALGLSFLTFIPRDGTPAGRWAHIGRDRYLAPAAALVGMRVRELHPRPAAQGLAESAEFQEHFVDSYYPLICAALRAGQPVLAWRGWPEPWDFSWGILTAESGDGLGVAGVVPGVSEPAPLSSAALQCYVVERFDPVQPDRLVCLRLMVDVLRECANSGAGAGEMLTGSAAFEYWLGWLGGVPAERALQESRRFAAAQRSSRAAGARFLRSCLAASNAAERAHFGDLIAESEAAEATFVAVERVESADALESAIRAAQIADGRLADRLLQSAADLVGTGG